MNVATVQCATLIGVHFNLHFLTLARNPPKWAPMLDSTFFFLASSSALFLASSSSFLCLSSWGKHHQLIIAVSFIFSFTKEEQDIAIWADCWHARIKPTYAAQCLTWVTAIRVCLSRSFSALTRCCSALSARRLSCNTKTQASWSVTHRSLLFWISFPDKHMGKQYGKLTILSLSPISSSSSFFLCSKWTSIRVCSSRRSFSILFLWISLTKPVDTKII